MAIKLSSKHQHHTAIPSSELSIPAQISQPHRRLDPSKLCLITIVTDNPVSWNILARKLRLNHQDISQVCRISFSLIPFNRHCRWRKSRFKSPLSDGIMMGIINSKPITISILCRRLCSPQLHDTEIGTALIKSSFHLNFSRFGVKFQRKVNSWRLADNKNTLEMMMMMTSWHKDASSCGYTAELGAFVE